MDFPEEGNTSVSTPHHSGFPRSDLSHRTAPPNPNPAGYEEFRTPDFPKALRTRPRVTWNRFPLFEGQVVSPCLLPPTLNSVVMATAVGGGGLDSSAPGQATQHAPLSPSFLPRCPPDRQGLGPAGPVISPLRVHTPGPHLQFPVFKAGGFPAQLSRLGLS